MGSRDSRPSEDHIRRARELVAILLPALREVARRHGYALAVHGSLERDIDLVATPWRDGAIDASDLIKSLHAACAAILGFATWPGGWTEKDTWGPPVGSLPNPDRKPYGRLGWSIILGGGPYLDVSVTPRLDPHALEDAHRAHKEVGALASLILRARTADNPHAVLDEAITVARDGFAAVDMGKLLPELAPKPSP